MVLRHTAGRQNVWNRPGVSPSVSRRLLRQFRWIDTNYSPRQPEQRYRKEWTLGQDDFGNAIPYRAGVIYWRE